MAIAFAAASLVERVGWLLVHSVWQFALIAIVLAVVLRMMRGAPAGARYAAALVGWGLMLIAPAVTWPLLPEPVPQSDAVTTAAPAVELAAESLPVPADTDTRLPTPAEAFDATVVEVAHGISSAPANVIASPVKWAEKLAARIAPWLNTLVVIWCAGVCLFGARSARGWFTVQGLLRRDVVSVPDEMTTLLVSVLKRVGLHHRVRLLQSPHVDVPLVVGWLRPVILLPVCVATGFSPAQLEAVLAHELAHIRRHDYLINLLQNLSETVFFYHPALWWASAVMRREREHCCDELAARTLGNRAEYGRALLALEELRGTTPSLALGAKGGSLLERIRRLAREPDPRPGAGGVAVGIGIAAAVILMAAVLTTSVADERKTDASAGKAATDSNGERSEGTFSFGGRVEVLAIGTHDKEPQQWWSADGKPLSSVPFEWHQKGRSIHVGNEKVRRVVMRIHDAPEHARINWRIVGSESYTGVSVTPPEGQPAHGYFGRFFTIGDDQDNFEIQVGVATGPWTTLTKTSHQAAHNLGDVKVVFSEPLETDAGTTVIVSHNVFDRAVRIIAIDERGKEHPQVGWGGTSAGEIYQATARFPRLKPEQVDHFEFQVRDYEWTEIGGLPLDPVAVASAEKASTGEAPSSASSKGRDEWVAKLLRLKNHNQTAFAIGPTMLSELESDEALAVTREAWLRINVDQVKTGLLKTFEFDRHPHVLEVLDLGATDESEDVRKYAAGYLQNYAFRDFGGDRDKYAAWRKETAGKPVLEVIKANAEWFVADQKSKMPADDQRWWTELETMLNVSGNKSSYPEKAMYLRDAGFVERLRKWADDPQAGPLVQTKSAELIRQIEEAIAAKSAAGGEGRPSGEGAARSGDRPQQHPAPADWTAIRESVKPWLDDAFQIDDAARRDAAIEAVRVALNSDDVNEQRKGLVAFSSMSEIRFDKASFHDVIARLLGSADGAVRATAARSLVIAGLRDGDRERLVALVSDADKQVRETIASSIVEASQRDLTGPPAGDSILKLLNDAEESVRIGTMHSMWGVKLSPEIEARIIEISRLPSRFSDGEPYQALYYVLSTQQNKSEASIKRLIEYLAHQDTLNVAGRAAWGLRQGVAAEQRGLVADAAVKVVAARSGGYLTKEALALVKQHAGAGQIEALRDLLDKPGVDGDLRAGLEEALKSATAQEKAAREVEKTDGERPKPDGTPTSSEGDPKQQIVASADQKGDAATAESQKADPPPYPVIVSTEPRNGAVDVDPGLTWVTVTFDRDMSKGMSWTGEIPIDKSRKAEWTDARTCRLPVTLTGGKAYRIGINSRSYRNFASRGGEPTPATAIHFATTGAAEEVRQTVRLPKIVSLEPANDAKDVDPAITRLAVTFDMPMGDGMSWVGGGENFPMAPDGQKASWSKDRLTCTLPVVLRPDHTYRLGLNAPKFQNFQSEHGVPLEPVIYTFSTRP